MKIIIVGGVAGGASAATRARRINPGANILIYEKGPAISFANCGLPYNLGGEIKDRSKLLVANADLFKRRFNIDVKTQHEVFHIDRLNREIHVRSNISAEEFKDSYDRLILSTGSQLISLPEIPYSLDNVFTLWSLDDLDKIKEYISVSSPKTVSVIGAGFVGLEVVEQLRHKGLSVQLIELAPQVLGPLDPEMASYIEDELVKHEVDIHLSSKVESVKISNNKATSLCLSSGTILNTDMIIAGVGVRPLSFLASGAELLTSPNGAVKVNEHYQTSDPNIYAVGDMAEYIFGPTNSPSSIPLAGPANRAGRIAGEHAASGKSQFAQKVYGTSIVRVFSKTGGVSGLSEKLCKRSNIDYRVSYISASHHASYFPGAKELVIKLLYAPVTGKLLGVQVVGEEGVDKRIDVVSTVLSFGGTVYNLASLDLAYAPPFGSAKDPLHQAAFVALNDLSKTPELAKPDIDLSSVQCVDVRTDKERQELPLKEGIHIPIDESVPFYENPLFANLDPNLETVVTCHSGKRAHIVASYLVGKGFKDVKNLSGGMMIRSRMIDHF
ncbi:MAG TPA: FAD-dependent oxidoreductase [Oligoflexia bacterium]|nr:FAD-dependent oxidoreductase [Oligoflexia bacterium]HMP48318.1 FAD-dependent oxidoreductase [Oligoflexia bacterium]